MRSHALRLVAATAVAGAFLSGGCASGGSSASGPASRQEAAQSRAATPGGRAGASASQPARQQLLGRQVGVIAAGLARQKIMYRQGPGLRDCSGMFHRVLLGLQKHYPGATLPSARTHRTTRQLARWYHQRGVLRRPSSARQSDHYIRPGTVMFFGRPGAARLATGKLLEPRGIVHMGVVVDVKKDAAGRVVEYGLFHGRSTGKPAAITRYHKRDHRRYPPYGNGAQPWVAFAPILGAVSTD